MSDKVFSENDTKNQPKTPITVSYFDNVRDNGARGFYGKMNNIISWPQFVKALKEFAQKPLLTKLDAFLFSPAIYKVSRSEESVLGSAELVLDSDGGLSFERARDFLKTSGFESIIYTSANHLNPDEGNKPKFRIVLPIGEIVDAATQYKAVHAFAEFMAAELGVEIGEDEGQWDLDEGKLNAYSIFYVPAQYACAGENLIEHIEGDLIDIHALLDEFPQPDPEPEFRPEPMKFNLSRDVEWNPYERPCWGDYLSKGDHRYDGLFTLMLQLAMSALNALYDITVDELAALGEEAQSLNPPSKRTSRRDWQKLKNAAEDALNSARSKVTDPSAAKWMERQHNTRLYGQAEPWTNGTRGVASLADMLEDLKSNPEQSAKPTEPGPDIEEPTEHVSASSPGATEPQPEMRAMKQAVLFEGSPFVSADEFLKRLVPPTIYWRGDHYTWRTNHYAKLEKIQMEKTVAGFLENSLTVAGKDEKLVPFHPKKEKLVEVLKAVQLRTLEPATREPVEELNGLIPCKNGLLDIHTGKLLAHDPKRIVLNCLPFDYNEDAGKPVEWLKFLQNVWPDDDGSEGGSISALQEMFGYLASGRTDFQKIFLLVGPKRSGKGTIGRILRGMLGETNVVGLTLENFGQQFGIQDAIGKSLAILSDVRPSARANLNAAVEKLLMISGEDKFSVARKFLGAWCGQLPLRLLFLSNEVPRLPDASGVIASRFVPIRMLISNYGREDLTLLSRLLPELPKILNWSLVGLKRLDRRGHFLVPEMAQQTVDDVLAAAAPHLTFIDDCVEWPVVGAHVEKMDLYGYFVEWCKRSGYQACNEGLFTQRLKMALPGLQDYRPKRFNGKDRPRCWKDMRVRFRGFYGQAHPTDYSAGWMGQFRDPDFAEDNNSKPHGDDNDDKIFH